jgi:hypothetical protein
MVFFEFMTFAVAAFAVATAIGIAIDLKVEGRR